MLLELATPSRLVVSAEVDEVVIPGEMGYFGVWPGHAPLLATLGPGVLSYRRGPGPEHLVALSGGFAEVTGERVIVLAEEAELPEEIDRARAERARQRAEMRLAGKNARPNEDEIDYARALPALARALARLQAATHAQRPAAP